MKYEFPILDNIEPILRVIEDREEFGHHFKGEGKFRYGVIDYNVSMRDTFPLMAGSEEDRAYAALRRETRGICYDPDTGCIISRPFHKFFNVGEREDTQADDINLSDLHHMLDKLDGSMIRTIFPVGGLLWGTRAGVTDVSEQARRYIEYIQPKIDYIGFGNEMADNGYTLMFEWCTRKNRIVLDYPEDRLVLTGMRINREGQYVTYSSMIDIASRFGIPYVETIGSSNVDMREFQSTVKSMTGVEGYVVAFQDGHRVKIKSDEYVLIHRSKDELRFEKNAIRIVLENKIDDVCPHLQKDDRDRLLKFADDMNTHITTLARDLMFTYETLHTAHPNRADFARAIIDHPFKGFLFHAVAGRDIREQIVKKILAGTSTAGRVEENRALIGARWTPIQFFDVDG